ncbi:cytochrome P450 [Streptomyces chattanoogensis]|uniref:cytochrome P450 n=1 Tax=Streptomyces chattanoogensis TaxID=66876 RepID=UPI0006B672A3|nr:cytochrome P450 [Streptomyces chattanoogensis]
MQMIASQATDEGAAQLVDGLVESLFFTPEGYESPYPLTARIRELAPVHYVSALNMYTVSSYDGCVRAYGRDMRLGTLEEHDKEQPGWRDHPGLHMFFRSMLMSNPPEHTRLRQAVVPFFTGRRVAELSATVEGVVDRALDALADAGSDGSAVNFQEFVGFAIPSAVAGRLMGVAEEDRARFQWIAEATSSLTDPVLTPEVLAKGDEAVLEAIEYFRRVIDDRRAHPVQDIPSMLVETGDLRDDELAELLVLMYAASYETTACLLGSGVAALLTHPQENRKLQQDPGLAANAVEEMLRWEAPAQLAYRYTTVDTEVAGTVVPQGTGMILLQGAANRDPLRFADPDRFDISRQDARHVAFGGGIHLCLGAHLARLEARLLFERLPQRFPRLAQAGEVQVRKAVDIRGPLILPVTV